MYTLLHTDHYILQIFFFPSFRNLADMDSDGKMDKVEFSIAMKLIKLKLQGRNLPSTLPVVMKQPPASNCGSTVASSARFGTSMFFSKIR